MAKVVDYDGKDIQVRWDGALCIHVGECGRADNDLFQAKRDPWCQPDLVGIGDVVDVVERCPTGALSYTRADGEAETTPPVNRVVVSNNGPLYVSGDLRIDGAAEEQEGLKFRAALCRCGKSANKPFCDGRHEPARFRDQGAVGQRGEELEAEGGPLEVSKFDNGPLMLKGNLRIVAASGRTAWSGTTAYLCRCGLSKNKPFCDGSHSREGWQE